MSKLKIYIKSILLPLIIGGIVGVVISPFIDYSSLLKPRLAPSSSAFPLIWTILYILMGLSYGILRSNKFTNQEIDYIYYVQLGFNYLWSIIFFILKWRVLAFIWIVVLAILIVFMILKFYNKSKIAGLLQIPYLIWVLFATYLNLAVYILNK